MDATKSFVKIYNMTPLQAEDFEFDFEPEDGGIIQKLVPSEAGRGDVHWLELEEYEYNANNQIMYFTLETKWAPPTEWLRNASVGTHYFENKLITMTTIQKDETSVTGIAIMDGEVLQNKPIFEMDLEEVSKHYDDDEPDFDLDELDNKIWDSIGKFTTVCEQFYFDNGEPK